MRHSADVKTLSGPAGGPGGASQDVGELVHAYGRQFLQRHVQLALEYYMLAARAAGDALPAEGRLLKELLTESKAYGVPLCFAQRRMWRATMWSTPANGNPTSAKHTPLRASPSRLLQPAWSSQSSRNILHSTERLRNYAQGFCWAAAARGRKAARSRASCRSAASGCG